MTLKIAVIPHELEFLFEAGTSRGVLKQKNVWYLKAFDTNFPQKYGIGEAGPLVGLSIDDLPDFEEQLISEIKKIEGNPLPQNIKEVVALVRVISDTLPSVRFGIESSLLDLLHGGKRKFFENPFFENGVPIQINGLVWMGNHQLMMERLNEKIEKGFRCIKVKIGAIDIEKEISLLEIARKHYDASQLELRVDANGAFTFEEAKIVLHRLKELDVHSIEQPIKAGMELQMHDLCAITPVPIALDEELIGYTSYKEKIRLLERIKPQYIILKPSLLGGFASTTEWIEIAKELGIGWWVTSALESNVGLNAICQFTSSLHVTLPQGLGTGNLYKNNIASPLTVVKDEILYDSTRSWGQIMK